MRTNSKQVREAIKLHILESVTDANGNYFETLNDACVRLYSEFLRVANHPYNLKRIPNDQERFSDYLNGLPFNFLFSYYEIQEYLNSLGINPENKEYSGQQSTHLYHYLIYAETLKAIQDTLNPKI